MNDLFFGMEDILLRRTLDEYRRIARISQSMMTLRLADVAAIVAEIACLVLAEGVE